ncbi:hypothetical protein ACO0K0_18030 [Undibacterium sp. SXout11W]|uniref:hypothetical protein n=1 Tax=Undibacterium sp. SXout11W TaxID=3413050 RepID=UPI003BF31757
MYEEACRYLDQQDSKLRFLMRIVGLRPYTERIKNMNDYHHHVSGFFSNDEEADHARTQLIERGLPIEQVRIFDTSSTPYKSNLELESNEVLQNVLVDGAIGTAVGTGIGAIGELSLVAANVSLFIASPLIAPLVMLGWGASLRALIGATMGSVTNTKHKDGRFADLIQDAISSGQLVLVVETLTLQETNIAREVIENLVGDYRETGTK